jgi:hypothetical protein
VKSFNKLGTGSALYGMKDDGLKAVRVIMQTISVVTGMITGRQKELLEL